MRKGGSRRTTGREQARVIGLPCNSTRPSGALVTLLPMPCCTAAAGDAIERQDANSLNRTIRFPPRRAAGRVYDVIDALSRVVRDNRLPPRDRDVLSDDLNRMREFRTRQNHWGAR